MHNFESGSDMPLCLVNWFHFIFEFALAMKRVLQFLNTWCHVNLVKSTIYRTKWKFGECAMERNEFRKLKDTVFSLYGLTALHELSTVTASAI